MSGGIVANDGGLAALPVRMPALARWRLAGPVALAVVSGVGFVLVQPGVSDMWAARARADASAHGVGLAYWFSWFSGGTAPGSYSVLSPFLSKLLTPEGVLVVSAVATVALCAVLLRSTAHPVVSTYFAAFAASINVWQGRVPFMLGCAFAAGALLAARRQRWATCSILALGALAASPVAGAFLGLALLGFWLPRWRSRRAVLLPLATLGAGALTLLLVFGRPGPEPMTVGLTIGMCSLLAAFLLARPPRSVRIIVYLSAAAILGTAVFPNGMGGNFARLVWFCLPVAVLALARGHRALLLALAVTTVAIGSVGLSIDLWGAAQPASTMDYYDPLVAELATIAHLRQYRVEVVEDGTHTAAYALLGHATLARGFETQTDITYNADLRSRTLLSAPVYRHWLDNNSVGYVAANLHPLQPTPESHLIRHRRPSYLRPIWSDSDWVVYKVVHPTPIVAAPATLVSIHQATMTVEVPCACSVTIRTHWSPLLAATNVADGASPDPSPTVTPTAQDWTRLVTSQPGRYVLAGR